MLRCKSGVSRASRLTASGTPRDQPEKQREIRANTDAAGFSRATSAHEQQAEPPASRRRERGWGLIGSDPAGRGLGLGRLDLALLREGWRRSSP